MELENLILKLKEIHLQLNTNYFYTFPDEITLVEEEESSNKENQNKNQCNSAVTNVKPQASSSISLI